MEVWISVLISGILTALAIIIGGYQIARAADKIVGEMSKNIGKAIEAIHADIKHSQEKLERKNRKISQRATY